MVSAGGEARELGSESGEGWVEWNERLYQLSEKHSGKMRSYSNLTEEERGRLGEWLLTL